MKTIDDFILELQRISADKRKLPLVIKAENNELFKPVIKMIMEYNYTTSINEVTKMIITYQ